jgi:hypothetical protein
MGTPKRQAVTGRCGPSHKNVLDKMSHWEYTLRAVMIRNFLTDFRREKGK